jgi:hypothetical protein
MDQTTLDQLKVIQRAVQTKHPNWPQEKARWIAMQMVGALTPRSAR